MKYPFITADVIKFGDIVPVFRLHMPKYNEAAWELEGKELYPQYESFEEYKLNWEQLEGSNYETE